PGRRRRPAPPPRRWTRAPSWRGEKLGSLEDPLQVARQERVEGTRAPREFRGARTRHLGEAAGREARLGGAAGELRAIGGRAPAVVRALDRGVHRERVRL